MADKSTVSQYKYKISMAYLDQKRGKNTDILVEHIKFMVIDHNYEVNSMPIIYLSMTIDKLLLDDMILNCNENLIMLALTKFDDLTDSKQEIQCFRKKFTYFLPNDVNKNDAVDYTENSEDETRGNSFRQITLGLMAIDLINNNKNTFKFLLKNTTIGVPVNEIMKTFKNVIIEPIGNSDVIPQLVLPTKDSANKALMELNNIKVFYNTPYRFYQDFNYVYLLSSSGRPISKPGEKYDSIIIDIKDILENDANEIGIIMNKSSKTYHIPVNYANTQIYDNTIINKSVTNISGMTSSGEKKISLKNKSSYTKDKTNTIRLSNDNEGMLDNIRTDKDNNNFLVYFMKNDLDTDVLSINKRITIHHIDRYREHDGDYLMYRKREYYVREDDTFIMSSMIDLKQIMSKS